jgi:Amt family ammonium transporter
MVDLSLAFSDFMGGLISGLRTFFLFKGVLDGKPWVLAATTPMALLAFF